MAINTGSFAAGQGDIQGAIQQAIQRRQQGGQQVPALSQQSAESTGQPSQIVPDASGASGGLPQPTAGPGGVEEVPDDEKMVIVKGLLDRLKMLGNIDRDQTKPAPPVGGGGHINQRA